jgi:hypothetical protein
MSVAAPADIGAEIEALLGRITAAGGPAATEVQELVRLLMAFYGAGLSRIVELMRAEGAHAPLFDRLTRDPLVASLLTLHNLQPPPSPPLIQILRAPRHEGSADGTPLRGERCELCDTPVPAAHAHVLDLDTKRLLCACAVCGGAGGRYRLVPSRYVHTPAMRLTAAQWETFGIPVGLAFFVRDSRRGCVVASYPGPAGATESVLPVDTWVPADAPWLREVAPDVEAVLVRRQGDGCVCYIVPLDACYELVGRIRRTWTGFSGGAAAQAEIDRFFADLAGRASRATELPA